MLGRNRAGKDVKPRRWFMSKALPAFLLAALMVLLMVGSPRAESWDEVMGKAKEEGTLVVVLGGGASRRYRPIFKFFENKFGIRTVASTGSGRKQAARILAERGAGKYKVDIIMTGDTTGNTRLLPNGVVDPIAPVLFYPEVVDRSLWYRASTTTAIRRRSISLPSRAAPTSRLWPCASTRTNCRLRRPRRSTPYGRSWTKNGLLARSLRFPL